MPSAKGELKRIPRSPATYSYPFFVHALLIHYRQKRVANPSPTCKLPKFMPTKSHAPPSPVDLLHRPSPYTPRNHHPSPGHPHFRQHPDAAGEHRGTGALPSPPGHRISFPGARAHPRYPPRPPPVTREASHSCCCLVAQNLVSFLCLSILV